MRTFFRERLPMHPRLGRHVNFDSRSRAYAVQPSAVSVTSIRWASFIDVLDQGALGSCTGNAGVGCIYRSPFTEAASTPWPDYSRDEVGAVALYEDATVADGFPGSYPPDDTGSDGLTICKVLTKAGYVSGYRAALDLDSSLAALMSGPGITGLPWYNSMFNVGSGGLLTVDTKSGLAGGHELCVDEVVAAGDPGNGTGGALVGGPNSWGPAWGDAGRWYMRVSDWWALRQRDGDVYFMTPATSPAPTPTPDPSDDVDARYWAQIEAWAGQPHTGGNRAAAAAARAWAKDKNFS